MTTATSEKHESNRHFYDRISSAYDLLADSNERAARLAGVTALDVQPGQRVLEVGFGTGNEVLDLARLVGSSGTVAGIDISSGMLAVAQRKVDAADLSARVALQVADARQLPFADDSYDAVYSSFTLELFAADDVPLVLGEIRRVLRPGGKLAGVSMAQVKTDEKSSALEHTYIWMHQHFPHIVDCRPIDLAELLSSAGFQVNNSHELKIWTMPVAVVVAEKTGRKA